MKRMYDLKLFKRVQIIWRFKDIKGLFILLSVITQKHANKL